MPFTRLAAYGLALGLVVMGCSGNDDSELLPSQTVSSVTPQLEPPPPLPPPTVREVQPLSTRSKVKVIDDGGEAGKPSTLAEASRRAKARKGQYGPTIAEINDENLHEYASKGEVIVLESAPSAPNPQLDEAGELLEDDDILEETPPGTRDEEYWRNRALELRMGWRRSVDRIQELELEAAALRQQFYAEDDPYIRDGQLKPAWDRVLDRILQLQNRSLQYEQELEAFVEDGRRSGAHQGWLNQGWELEPTPEEMAWKTALENRTKDQLEKHQSKDPDTSEEVFDP